MKTIITKLIKKKSTNSVAFILGVVLFSLILLTNNSFCQTLIAEYEFAGTLTDRLSGSSLTAWGPTPTSNGNTSFLRNNIETAFLADANGDYWWWKSDQAEGGGFYIDVNTDIRTNYSIGLRFAFNETGSGYKKIIDYENCVSDNGFYFYGNKLTFYPSGGTGATTIANNQLVDLVVTRATDGVFKAYFVVNGVVVSTPEINYNAGVSGSPVLVNGKPRFGFFYNDNRYTGEATKSGKVYGIKIWNAAFTSAAEIQAAMNPKAIIADVAITGATGVAITPKSINVTLLQSIVTSGSISQGTDLSSWITNLPAGLTAVAKTDINAGASNFAIEVTGTPSAVLSAPVQITIPSSYLTPAATVTVAQNLNGVFGISPYTVTYNGNSNTGGTAPVDGNNYAAGATVTVLSNSSNLVKTGYNFAGWNTQADGSGTPYAAGSTFSIGTYNVTLFARWTLAATPPPTVTTQAATSVTQTTATGNGNITNLGSPNPTAHGVCYGTSQNPSINNASFTNRGSASSTGAFSSALTGLIPGTTYYLRAYATNSGGTSYGEEISFTTVAISCTFTDGSMFSVSALPGNSDQAIGRFQLSAASSGVSLTAVSIQLNGIRSNVVNFKLWYSSDNSFSSTTDAQLGSTFTYDPGEGNSVVFSSFSQPVNTSGGYYFLTCDLAANASGTIAPVIVNNNSLTFISGSLSGTINYNPLAQNSNPLPAELKSLSASVKNRDVILKWQTATEINSSGFEVERRVKFPSQDFDKVGFKNAHGNSNSPKEYSFIDKNLPSGTYIYRLKMIDNDGSFKYSDEINVCIDKPSITDLKQNYPNCFNPATKIEYQLAATSRFKLELYNITGHLVSTLIEGEAEAGYYFYYLDMNKINNGLATGVYLYRMTVKDINSNTSKSFVKKLLFMK